MSGCNKLQRRGSIFVCDQCCLRHTIIHVFNVYQRPPTLQASLCVKIDLPGNVRVSALPRDHHKAGSLSDRFYVEASAVWCAVLRVVVFDLRTRTKLSFKQSLVLELISPLIPVSAASSPADSTDMSFTASRAALHTVHFQRSLRAGIRVAADRPDALRLIDSSPWVQAGFDFCALGLTGVPNLQMNLMFPQRKVHSAAVGIWRYSC